MTDFVSDEISWANRLEQALQTLLLDNGFMDDLDVAGTTLRNTRNVGLLAPMSPSAQATILSGTLYSYSSAVQPLRRQRSHRLDASSRASGTSTAILEAPSQPSAVAQASEAFREFRLRLDRLLETEEDDDFEKEVQQLLHQGEHSPAMLEESICSTVALNDSLLSDFEFPAQGFQQRMFHQIQEEEALDEILSRELQAQFSGTGMPGNLDATLVVDDEQPPDSGQEMTPTHQSALDDTSATSDWSAAAGNATAQTIWSETMNSEMVATGYLPRARGDRAITAVLRRFASVDPELMEEAIERSVRRVLELSTTMSGVRHLSEVEIQSLPKISFRHPDASDEEDQCTICLDQFKDGDLLTSLPRCHHFFHSECIARWFHQSEHCPLCRGFAAPDACDT